MLALLMFALPPAPVEPEVPVMSTPPSLVKIKAGGKLEFVVTTFVAVTKKVKVVVEIDGKKVEQERDVVEMVPVQKIVMRDLSTASVSTAGGKKLDAEAAKKALDKDQVVLLASGPVDAAFLKALKEDTLVIVEKPAAPPKLPRRPDPAPVAD